jgi:hypothetical protein
MTSSNRYRFVIACATVLACTERSVERGEDTVDVRRVDVAEVPGDDGDRALIEHMQKRGVDLTRPHLVDFIFAAKASQALDAVCADLGKRGYKVAVEPPGVAHDFPICRATQSLVVNAEVIAKLRAEHEALARSRGAELDGWELDPR